MTKTNEKLPIAKVLLGAFVLPWRQRQAFAKALAIPALALVALTMVWQLAGSELSGLTNWLLYLVYGALFSWFAVACHRLVLIGPAPPELRWSQRQLRFFGWLAGVYLIYVAISLLLTVVLGTLAANTIDFGASTASRGPLGWFWWAQLLASIAATYFLARLSLVFPAVAVDHRVHLRWSWERSKHNGWRLAVVVGLLPWVLSLVLAVLYREGASVPELALLVLLGVLVFVMEIAAFSLSYRALSGKEAG